MEIVIINENSTLDGPLSGPAIPRLRIRIRTTLILLHSLKFQLYPQVDKYIVWLKGTGSTRDPLRLYSERETLQTIDWRLENAENDEGARRIPNNKCRERRTILRAKYPFIVNLRDILVGDKSSRCVAFRS